MVLGAWVSLSPPLLSRVEFVRNFFCAIAAVVSFSSELNKALWPGIRPYRFYPHLASLTSMTFRGIYRLLSKRMVSAWSPEHLSDVLVSLTELFRPAE